MMVENCIGKLSLPLGVGLNFQINGKDYIVPMATEEPSVIAAASGAAKMIKEKASGFIAWSSEPVMIGQIQMLDVLPEEAIPKIEARKSELLSKI